MQGKSILITGGNSGIGKATAIALAKQGAQICIGCRDPKKGEAAVAQIKDKSGSEKISYTEIDLSSFDSIRNMAKSFNSANSKLDILINNAGVFVGDLAHTVEGYEMQFGVNHLGHFLLTSLLLPSLQNAPVARIVNVSSIAYMHGSIDFDNLRGEKGDYSSIKAYAQSKLANVLFTRSLAKKYATISSNCLHPGVVRTPLANKNSKWYVSFLWSLYKPFMCTPEKGARTSVYLASSERLEGVTGQFFDEKRCRRNLTAKGTDEQLAEKLWNYSEQAIKM